jgi:hypothetical protein
MPHSQSIIILNSDKAHSLYSVRSPYIIVRPLRTDLESLTAALERSMMWQMEMGPSRSTDQVWGLPVLQSVQSPATHEKLDGDGTGRIMPTAAPSMISCSPDPDRPPPWSVGLLIDLLGRKHPLDAGRGTNLKMQGWLCCRPGPKVTRHISKFAARVNNEGPQDVIPSRNFQLQIHID